MKIQVVNSKGQVPDPYRINWKKFTRQNFPYRFRQSTGCDNALGIMKFNLNSPYSVYLHDTNLKLAFNFSRRYLSHGCVRIQKPVALANKLLEEPLDEAFLNAGIKGQQPVIKLLPEPVPVFILYMTADVMAGKTVHYFADSYHLVK
ncbi:hypothetical protein A8C56_07400 [Niabella ginsenosidivorans]|uniref:L,D-TPase catalytic domain-containing protein n=1 Tax=Niabella ginsenosidivorans TaxID=1176587 RepID=A0A1A9HZK2_9BACT|nr:L,D-transpeptidase family protein [Niabella ginsenosidivorans]ANH80828.1 hypothetical protein A8C56_07400 [Niabella ginsenosidivorans]